MSKRRHSHAPRPEGGGSRKPWNAKPAAIAAAALLALFAVYYGYTSLNPQPPAAAVAPPARTSPSRPLPAPDVDVVRAFLVSERFHDVYTPCWEGAYGAIGDAYLYAATHDSSLREFHLVKHDLTAMCAGTWVDDRAWVSLAEFAWWDVTGRNEPRLVADARRRYDEARREGRFAHPDGYWSWYNFNPASLLNGRVFTNSNMNQMVTVACRLYEATGEERYRQDALLAWNGDGTIPGIEKTWYRGRGVWRGKGGPAAFGDEIPWRGAGYCTVAAALYRMTHVEKYRRIAVATARRLMDPATGWVDRKDFYQLRMDGNGAFVNFMYDAYALAPDSLPGLPKQLGRMLDHVWTNAHGTSQLTLHRETDNGIRNGWNPSGGEDGYGVDEIGTVHAQGEAARAFGIYAFLVSGKARDRP